MRGRIGVYLCSCGTNISDNLDFKKLIDSISLLDKISYVKTHKLLCSEDGKSFLLEDIKKESPEKLVIAACSPKEHEKTFRNILEKAGLNPFLFQMVNVREQVAWVTSDKDKATKKAEAYIRAAVRRVDLQEPLEKKEVECNSDVLVIGAGPAGMEASLLIANAGRKVYLVEKNSFLGGKVARYEDVFPKMECASCMLEPKMDEVLHHENIELLTLSEVQEVLGFLGNFIVKIKRKAHFIDKEKCIGCGACFESCPVSVDNEYDYNLSKRKAIYLPYTGALPNVPVIDFKNCLRFKGDDEAQKYKEAFELGLITRKEYEELISQKENLCTLCKDSCPFGAIDYEAKDEIIERSVGAIIIATGFELFNPSEIPELGYGKIPEVYTGLEFERLLSQTGPTNGKILMKNSRVPESFAIVHCVGSRDKRYKNYCSGVCCLYALKFVYMIKKQLPDTLIYEILSDWCVPGKDNQGFLDSIMNVSTVNFIHTSEPSSTLIKQVNDKVSLMFKDINNKKSEIVVDMVILCPAMIPPYDNLKLSNIFNINIDEHGFFAERHTKLEPVNTNVEGILVAGCCQGPKDISNSIAQAEAAAGKVLSILIPGRKLELEIITAEVDEYACSGCKICVGLCPYKAISFDIEKKVAFVNDVLCKGCGTCVASCPSAAIKGKHFTREQIFAEIEEVLR